MFLAKYRANQTGLNVYLWIVLSLIEEKSPIEGFFVSRLGNPIPLDLSLTANRLAF